jgi:hypothetical protein
VAGTDAGERTVDAHAVEQGSITRRLEAPLSVLLPWLPHSGWGVQLSYDCPPHPGCPQSQGCDCAILCSHWALQKRLSVRLSQVHGGCAHFIAVSFAVVLARPVVFAVVTDAVQAPYRQTPSVASSRRLGPRLPGCRLGDRLSEVGVRHPAKIAKIVGGSSTAVLTHPNISTGQISGASTRWHSARDDPADPDYLLRFVSWLWNVCPPNGPRPAKGGCPAPASVARPTAARRPAGERVP